MEVCDQKFDKKLGNGHMSGSCDQKLDKKFRKWSHEGFM
jgi:hypothetical protein